MSQEFEMIHNVMISMFEDLLRGLSYIYFIRGWKTLKTANHIDHLSLYVHVYTLKNSRKNDCRGWFLQPAGF